jgi:hypothetical protein
MLIYLRVKMLDLGDFFEYYLDYLVKKTYLFSGIESIDKFRLI